MESNRDERYSFKCQETRTKVVPRISTVIRPLWMNYCFLLYEHGFIAHLVEQRTKNPYIIGSNPIEATIFIKTMKGSG